MADLEEPKGEIDSTLMVRRAGSLLGQLIEQTRDEAMAFFMTAYLLAEYNRCEAQGVPIDEERLKEEAYEYLEAHMRGEQLHPRLPLRTIEE